LTETLKRSSGRITVFGNLLKQMNAKVQLDLYRVKIPLATAMVVGVDVVNEGRKSILGFTASYTKYLT
jgi:aubergine-like protein